MTNLKLRIRVKLDKAGENNFYSVAEEIIKEGVSNDELREILPDLVRTIAKARTMGGFLPDTKDIHTPDDDDGTSVVTYTPRPVVHLTTSSGASAELLPKARPVFTPSSKVSGFQANRLEELYYVGGTGADKYKKFKDMNKEDIRFAIRGLEGQKSALQNRIVGWEKVLYQMDSYKVNVVSELPDKVKAAI